MSRATYRSRHAAGLVAPRVLSVGTDARMVLAAAALPAVSIGS